MSVHNGTLWFTQEPRNKKDSHEQTKNEENLINNY